MKLENAIIFGGRIFVPVEDTDGQERKCEKCPIERACDMVFSFKDPCAFFGAGKHYEEVSREEVEL